MNPRTVDLLSRVVVVVDGCARDDKWLNKHELYDKLPVLQREVEALRKQPREKGEPDFVNDITRLCLDCLACSLRGGPFGDHKRALEFRMLAEMMLKFVRADLAGALDHALKVSTSDQALEIAEIFRGDRK